VARGIYRKGFAFEFFLPLLAAACCLQIADVLDSEWTTTVPGQQRQATLKIRPPTTSTKKRRRKNEAGKTTAPSLGLQGED
jgi:hypothetical protein